MAVPTKTGCQGQRNTKSAAESGDADHRRGIEAGGRTVRETKGSTKVFDESSYDKAVGLAGWKGYLTNIDAKVMTARGDVGAYHDLWHVEQSFRMSKTDPRVRPIFHRTRDAIDLTVVFTALAVARFMQESAGLSLKKIITTLRPLHEFMGEIYGDELVFPPDDPLQAAELVSDVENLGPGAGRSEWPSGSGRVTKWCVTSRHRGHIR